MNWRDEYHIYLKDEADPQLAPNSISAYCSDMDVYADWFLRINGQEFAPYDLVGPDVREFRRWCLDTGRVKASTWNRRRASLIRFANWCKENNYIQGNPLHGVPEQDQRTLPPYWLKPDEFRAFRRQMEINVNRAKPDTQEYKMAVRERAIFSLMLYAGLRVGECVNLRRNLLLLSDRKGRVTVRNGKGNADAVIPLNYEARTALEAWLAVAPDGELVFDVTARTPQRRIKELAIDARLDNADDITCHWLRHTCARRLAVKDDGTINNPPGFVQVFMRHKRLDTTQQYYRAAYNDLERMADGL